MPFSVKSIEEKPYNACLNCAHIGKNCDGPNFLAMSVDRWCEWCRLRKEYLGWTNAHVAELAEISKISVDRVMSANVKDLRISTMQAITRVLVNGTWGQHPCAMSSMDEGQIVYVDNPVLIEKAESASRECQQIKAVLDSTKEDDQRKIDYLKEQVQFKEDQMKAKDQLIAERCDFLKRKDKAIKMLSIFLVSSVLFNIVLLIV